MFAKSGLSLLFWNDDALSEYPMTEKAIITEGEPDALAVLQSGYGCVVSVPNGTPEQPTEGTINPFDDKRCAYLWNGGELRERSCVVLAVDADAPGRVLQGELAIRIGKKRCYYVQYPDDSKDCNDVLKAYGVDGVRKLIEEAKPYVGGVVPFFDAPPDPPPTYYCRLFGRCTEAIAMTVAKSKIVRPYAPDYVDATTLAYRLCVSESTVEKLVRTGKLPRSRDVLDYRAGSGQTWRRSSSERILWKPMHSWSG